MLEHTLPRLKAFQRLHREWRSHLTVAERDFLGWFMDNTICWGRTSLRVTVKQMAEGTHWLRPSDIPERSLWRIIGSLKAKGLLAVKAGGRVTEFLINLFWTPEDPMLSIPKRLKERAEDAEGAAEPAKLADGACQIGSPYIEDVRKEDAKYRAASQRSDWQGGGETGEADAALRRQPSLPLVRRRVRPAPSAPAEPAPVPATSSPMDAIKAVMAKTAARRAEKAKPLTNVTVWRHAWEATYEGVPIKTLGQRDLGMLATLRKRVERGSLDWNDFLNWTVTHWRETMANKFDWMTRAAPPTFPEVGFLVRFVDAFLDAYASRMERDAIEAAPPEVAEYRKMRASGMAHDTALIEIGKRRAASEGRDEVAKEREHVNRMYRVIEAERKKLERQRMQATVSTPAASTKPVIKHGDNPYEQENPDIVDFSKLDLRWEE